MRRTFSTPNWLGRPKKSTLAWAVAALCLSLFALSGVFFPENVFFKVGRSWGKNVSSFLNQTDIKNNNKINIISMDGQDLIIENLKEGEGLSVEGGDTVSVHYVGTFESGEEFDSSRRAGREPFQFTVGSGQVIRGWDLGVVGMRIGEVRKLVVPSSLAYGPDDYGPIPGGSTLIFEIELLSIFKK